MSKAHAWLRKIRFFVTAGMLYAFSLACVWAVIRPAHASGSGAHAATLTKATIERQAADRPNFNLVVGRPVRIVIRSVYVYQSSQYVNVPVDQGYYSNTNNAWTLSGYHAQFDMASSPANNYGGETFIYGHNNDYVFGAFRHHPPVRGAEALVYAANGHVFAYTFVRSQKLSPSNVSVLNYQGAPMLLIQTCTGSLNEWRTMYWFTFEKVVQ